MSPRVVRGYDSRIHLREVASDKSNNARCALMAEIRHSAQTRVGTLRQDIANLRVAWFAIDQFSRL
jgi:hypothetical protein